MGESAGIDEDVGASLDCVGVADVATVEERVVVTEGVDKLVANMPAAEGATDERANEEPTTEGTEEERAGRRIDQRVDGSSPYTFDAMLQGGRWEMGHLAMRKVMATRCPASVREEVEWGAGGQ